jgi:hypothetical protein
MASASAPRTYYGIAIDTLSKGDSRGRYAAFVAQRWVFGNTLPEVRAAMREVNGMGRRPNGYTYA